MNILNSIKNFNTKSKLNAINQEAFDRFTINCYEGKLYYVSDGVPIIPIEETANAKDIAKQVTTFRKQFINYRLNDSKSAI